MDLNGKKSTQINSIKDSINGMLPCEPANYKFTNSGIYFENAEFQTFVYDFETEKMVEVKDSNFYYIEDHSRNLQEFAILDYDWETNNLVGSSLVDKNGKVLKDLQIPADAKLVKVDISSGTVSYFVKTAYFEKKY